MQYIIFTPIYASSSLKLTNISGSEYPSGQYEASSIYTPHDGSESTASLINSYHGSGSLTSFANGDYSGIVHTMKMKALGDGLDAIYDFAPSLKCIQFPTGTTSISQSYKKYAESDTSLAGSYTNQVLYFVDGTSSQPVNGSLGSYSGSHAFTNSNLTSPASPGIYVIASTGTGSLLPTVSAPHQIPVFNGKTYTT
jgi:hypothetical protein